MGLTSEQARELNTRPRINPVEKEQMINHAVEGKKPAEVALLFPQYAKGTIANLLSREKQLIEDRRHKRMVQFEDLTIVRKQARLDDLQKARDIAWGQLQALLEQHQVIDGVTGEVVQRAVDPRLFKASLDCVIRVLKEVDETTGQRPQRVDGLDSRYTAPVLGVRGSFDYVRFAELEAQREAEAAQEAAWKEQEQRFDSFDWVLKKQERALGLDPYSDPELQVKDGAEWSEEDYAELRADCLQRFPGDEWLLARVERVIEAATGVGVEVVLEPADLHSNGHKDSSALNGALAASVAAGEGDVQELWRVNPPRREPVEELKPDVSVEPAVEEPESEPEELELPADVHAALNDLLA